MKPHDVIPLTCILWLTSILLSKVGGQAIGMSVEFKPGWLFIPYVVLPACIAWGSILYYGRKEKTR